MSSSLWLRPPQTRRGAVCTRRGRGWLTARRWVGMLAAAPVILALCAPAAQASGSWPMAGQSILGNRSAPLDLAVNPQTVSHLKPKWVFTDHGDVSATPTVADGVVYFPDFGGYLNAVNAKTGALIWQQPISSYDGQGGTSVAQQPVDRGQ